MKKKILGIVVMAAIALTAGWNINQNNNDIQLSDLALDNVEALAGCEVNDWVSGSYYVTIYSGCLWSCRQGGPNNCPI